MIGTTPKLVTAWGAGDAARKERAEKRRQWPLVRLWDAEMAIIGRVHGEISASFTWVKNEAGPGKIVLPSKHWLVSKVVDVWGRPKENIVITVDKDGARWSGVLKKGEVVKSDNGERRVILNFLHDFHLLQKVYAWSNPFLPATVQFPRYWWLIGPAVWTLKSTLFANLMRLERALWKLPDEPFDVAQWGKDVSQWQIAVKPTRFVEDKTPTIMVASRFRTWTAMAQHALDDCGLVVECRRWLTGDPEPWAGYTPRNGQLIVDILDKSGKWSEDGYGLFGTLGGKIRRAVRGVEANQIDETETLTTDLPDPVEYFFDNWLSTTPAKPFVVYRDGALTGVESASFTWEPATAVQIVGGGKSMAGVNEAVSAAIIMAGNLAGTFIMQPGLGAVADTLLKPLYTDVFLAWYAARARDRIEKAGWVKPWEHYATGSENVFSLSGVMAMRAGFWETRARTGHQLKIRDGAPWFIGDRGQGHFFLGDRVASTLEELPDNRMIVEEVSQLELAWDRDHFGWEALLGDPRSNEDPIAKISRQISTVFENLHNQGVI